MAPKPAFRTPLGVNLCLLLNVLALSSLHVHSQQQCGQFVEGSSTKIGEFDLQDEDDNYRHHMQGAMVMLENPEANYSRDVELFLNKTALPDALQNRINATYNRTEKVLRVVGSATVKEYEQVLNNVLFRDTASEPDLSDRSVVFAVTDGSFMSDPVQLTITVQPDNDNAPQLVLMPRVVSITEPNENTMVGAEKYSMLAVSANISDMDHAAHNEIQQAWISITPDNALAGNFLELQQINGISIRGNHTQFLEMNGTANPSAYNSALTSVRYGCNATEPLYLNLTIRYVVFDGVHNSSVAQITVNITSVNDHTPMIQIGGRQRYTDTQGEVLIASGIDITDGDFQTSDQIIQRVTIETDKPAIIDINTTQADSYGIVVNRSMVDGVTQLSLSGLRDIIMYENVLRNLTFSLQGSNFTCQKEAFQHEVRITVWDSPGNSSSIILLDLVLENQHKPIVELDEDSISIVEVNNLLSESNKSTPVMANVALRDPDDRPCRRSNITEAVFMFSGQDSMEENLSLNISISDLVWNQSICNSSMVCNGLPMSASSACYRLSGEATIDTYQGALGRLQYNTRQSEPRLSQRFVGVKVFDGQQFSNCQVVTLNISPVNDWMPYIAFPNSQDAQPLTVEFSEGISTKVFIANNSLLMDDDVTYAQHRQVNHLQVDVTSYSALSSVVNLDESQDNITVVGDLSRNLTLTYTGSIPDSNESNFSTGITSSVLQQLVYYDNSSEPTDASITLTTSPSLRRPAVVNVKVMTVDDNPPILLLNGSGDQSNAIFTEDGSPVYIFPNISITDADTNNISQTYISRVEITLDNVPDGASEAFTNLTCEALHVSHTGHSLEIGGSNPKPIEAIIQCLNMVQYTNTAPEPDDAIQRLVNITVFSGPHITSGQGTITIERVCDSPTFTFSHATYTEAGTGVAFIRSISNPDRYPLNITAVNITLSSLEYIQGKDTLQLSSYPSAASFDVPTGQLTVTVSGNSSTYTSLIAAVNFNTSSQNPTNLYSYRSITAQLTYTCFDGNSQMSPLFHHNITIQPVDNAPVVSLAPPSTNISITHDVHRCIQVNPTVLFPSVSISDPDDTLVDYIVVNLTNGAQLEEMISFDVTSTDISADGTTINLLDNPAISPVLIRTYNLTVDGGDNISSFLQVLATARYWVNDTSVDQLQTPRIITVVAVRNTLRSRVAYAQVSFNSSTNGPCFRTLPIDRVYVEDSPPVTLLPANYSIEAGIVAFLDEVRVTLTGPSIASSLSGSSPLPAKLSVAPHNATTEITLRPATVNERFSFTTTVAEHFLRNITFSTPVQETLNQSIRVTVAITDIAAQTGNQDFFVTVMPRNDVPILSGCSLCRSNLVNYLPEARSFRVADLANTSQVSDADGSDLPYALVLTAIDDQGRGYWQHRDGPLWQRIVLQPLGDGSCMGYVLDTNSEIRFVPTPSTSQNDTSTVLTFRAYDYHVNTTSDAFCPTGLPTDSVSDAQADFVLDVMYLNRPPLITTSVYLASIKEDIEDMINTGWQVANVMRQVANDSDNLELGMAVTAVGNSGDGSWQSRGSANDSWMTINSSMVPHLLLSSSYIRFSPAKDYFGTVMLTAHAWDMTGDDFSTVTAVNSSFSNSTFTANLTITAIDDPAVLTDPEMNVTFMENGDSTQLFGAINVSDVDTIDWSIALNFQAIMPVSGCTVFGIPILNITNSMSPQGVSHRVNTTLTTNFSGNNQNLTTFLRSFRFGWFADELSHSVIIANLSLADVIAGNSRSIPVSVNMHHINDNLPTLSSSSDIFSFTEGSAAVSVFSSGQVNITDADCPPTLSSAVIIVSHANSENTSLSVSLPSDVTITMMQTYYSNNSTTALSLHGQASAAVYESALNSLTYLNSAEEPDLQNGTIRVSVNDGRTQSNSLSITLLMIPINDQPPILSLNTNTPNFSTNFTEVPQFGNLSYAINIVGSVSLSDSEPGNFSPDFLEVELVNSTRFPLRNETLLGNGSLLGDMINFTHAAVEEYITALNTIQYIMYEKDYPDGEVRMVRFRPCDNSVCGNSVYTAITLVARNDVPTILFRSSEFRYLENNGTVLVADDLRLSDVDSRSFSQAVINVTDLSTTVANVSFSMQNTTNFNITRTMIGDIYQLKVRGVQPVDQYTQLLRNLLFLQTSDDPMTNISLCLAVSDDMGATSLPACKTIVVVPVNDHPIVDLNGRSQGINYTTTFTEGAIGVAVADSLAQVLDIERNLLSSMNLTLTNVLDSNETLELTLPEFITGIDVSRKPTGMIISGLEPAQTYMAILRNITYINPSQFPSTTRRIIAVQVTDNAGGISRPAYTAVDVIEVDDEAALYLDGSTMSFTSRYTEDRGPVDITGSTQYMDVDDAYVTGVEITLSNIRDSGNEAIYSTSTNLGKGLTKSNGIVYNRTFPTPGISISDVENFLNTLQYNNLRDEPTSGIRNVMVNVFNRRGRASASGQIIVITVNDRQPSFNQSVIKVSIPENTASLTLSNLAEFVRDPDSDVFGIAGSGSGGDVTQGNHSYSIVSCTSCNDEFQLNTDGQLILQQALDRENTSQYNLTVRVVDEGLIPPAGGEAVVMVIVLDENDNVPQVTSVNGEIVNISSSFVSVSVDENSQFNASIVVVDNDTGSNNNVTLSLVSDANDVFQLNGRTIVSRALFDYETSSTFTLNVSAQDGGSPPLQSFISVIVDVNNINDNPPVFAKQLYNTTIKENTANGELVFQANATDIDAAPFNIITYSIVSVQPVGANGTLAIHSMSGTVTVSNSSALDRETYPNITVLIRAHDSDFSDNTTLLLLLSDENDNGPRFTQNPYIFVTREDFTPVDMPEMHQFSAAACTHENRVQATDEDVAPNNVVSYSILNASLELPFDIDSTSGVICRRNSSLIDWESKTLSYSFTVEARDGNNTFTDTARVLFNVTDINDNVPMFNTKQLVYTVNETTEYFLNFSAFDFDSSPGLSYDVDDPKLMINSSGIVKIPDDLLDREVQADYLFTVTVKESGPGQLYNQTAVVQILIEDLNDNPPVIHTSYQRVVVNETTAGVLGFNISTSDADSGRDNSNVTLDLISGNLANFSLDPNGQVLLNNPLDFERIGSVLDLMLRAYDHGTPSLSSETNLSIAIQNINDEQPRIVLRPANTHIAEEFTKTQLLSGAILTDPDMPMNPRFLSADVHLLNQRAMSLSGMPFVCEPPEMKADKLSACGFTGMFHLLSVTTFNGADFSRIATDPVKQTSHLFIAVWLKLTVATGSNSTIVSRTQTLAGVNISYATVCDTTSGALIFQYVDFNDAGREVVFAGGCITGVWQHVALYAEPDATVALYINGSLLASANFSSFKPASGRLWVGAGYPFDGPALPLTNYFSGEMFGLVVQHVPQPIGLINCFMECGETLAVDTHPIAGLQVSYSSGILTFTGNASAGVYQNALASLVYVDTAEEPLASGTRSLSYRVFDGVQHSKPALQNLTLVLSNEADPILLLNGSTRNDYNAQFTEGSTGVLIGGSSLSLTDADRGHYYIQLHVQIRSISDPGHERLFINTTVANSHGIAAMYDSSTGFLNISGLVAVGSMQEVARTLQYVNTAEEPSSIQRHVDWNVSESERPFSSPGRQVRTSIQVTSVVTLVLTNDRPQVMIASPLTVTYVEGATEVSLIHNLSIRDVDNTTLSYAVIGFMNWILGNGSISVNRSLLATGLTMTLTQKNLTIVGSASLKDYARVLRSLVYTHTFELPVPSRREISLIVSDGLSRSALVTVGIQFTAVNDPPILDLSGLERSSFDVNVTYREEVRSVYLAPNAIISDVDSASLLFVNISLPPFGSLFYNASISTIEFSSREGVLRSRTDRSASVADFTMALRSIQYEAMEQDGSGSGNGIQVIELQFVASDGINRSAVATARVTFIPVSDAPVLRLGNSTLELLESINGQAASILLLTQYASFFDTDPYRSTLTRITIRIHRRFDGMQESLSSSGSFDGITFVSSPTGDLILEGSALQTTYLQALRTVRYNNTAAEPLNFPRSVQFEVEDGPYTSAPTNLTILILYVNDNAPVLQLGNGTPNFNLTFCEGQENVSIVFNHSGSITDKDMNSPTITNMTVELLNPQPGDRLILRQPAGVMAVNTTNDTIYSSGVSLISLQDLLGSIYFQNLLDEPASTVRNINVIVNQGPFTVQATTRLTIEFFNDNLPVFPYQTVVVNASESVIVPHHLLTVLANDVDDVNMVRTTVFSLMDTFMGQFAVDPMSGNLTVERSLDYENSTRFDLHVIASDPTYTGAGATNSSIVITVLVGNVNDNSPMFNRSLFLGTVSEDENNGTSVLRLTASDSDGDIVEYFLESTGVPFTVHRWTGDILVAGRLDFESRKEYNLSVGVRDRPDAGNTDYASVRISIDDVDDNPLVVQPPVLPTVTFAEEGPAVGLFGGLQLLDNDVSALLNMATVRLSMARMNTRISTNSSHALISLTSPNNVTVQLTGTATIGAYQDVLRSLVYTDTSPEPQPGNRTVTLYLQDSFTGSMISVNQTIDISLINDNIPEVSLDPQNRSHGNNVGNYDFLDGTVPPGSFLTDYMEKSQVPIPLANTDAMISDADSGLNTIAYIRAEIRAGDGGSGFAPGEEILQLREPSCPGNFSFDVARGFATVTGPLSAAEANEALLCIRYRNTAEQFLSTNLVTQIRLMVSDGQHQSLVRTTYILLVPVYDDPSITFDGKQTTDAMIVYVENSQAQQVAPQLTIQDPDSSNLGSASITLVGQYGSSETINISRSNGLDISLMPPRLTDITGMASVPTYQSVLRSVLYTNTHMNQARSPTRIIFEVRDPDGRTAMAILTVYFFGLNNLPRLSLNGFSSTANGTRDIDVIYTEGSSPIKISAQGRQLIEDIDNTHMSELQVTACGLQDGRDEVIDFSQAHPFNTSHSSMNNSCQQWRFQVNSSIARYSKLLESFAYINTKAEPTPGVREVTFVVVDTGNGTTGSEEASVPSVAFISIEHVNDNTPMFDKDLYTATVKEGLTSPLNVTLIATDQDRYGSDNLTFTILPPGNMHFSVIAISGAGRVQLAVSQPLDSDSEPRLLNVSLIVVVSDNSATPAARSSSTTVNVQVIDVNDNQPEFILPQSYSRSVSEVTPISTVLVSVTASDSDGGENGDVSYSLFLASPSGSGDDLGSAGERPLDMPFSIDAASGNISLLHALDFESIDSYNLSVVATDHGVPSLSATASIQITVININDNSPRFENHPSSIEVQENTSSSTSILRMRATDIDAGDFGRVTYSTNSSDLFSIDENDGVLRVAQQLDFETLGSPVIPVLVIATDGGNPPRKNTTTVTVIVTNINDVAPQFSASEYNFTIPEDQANNSVVFQVSATDEDNIAALMYSTHNTELFRISSDGKVMLFQAARERLDYEERRQFNFSVQVSDGRAVDTAVVAVFVTDVNDNAPMFPAGQTRVFSVNENSPNGTVVGNVTATDADSGLNAQLVYTINTALPFAVDAMGHLTVSSSLDRETASQFAFNVSVSDGPFISNVSIVVDVLDTNDVKPVVSIPAGAGTVVYLEGSGMLHIVPTLSISDQDTTPLVNLTIRLELPQCRLSPSVLRSSCATTPMPMVCEGSCAEMISLPGVTSNGSYIVHSRPESPENYTALLNRLMFVALAEDPYPGERRVIVTVSDGVAFATGSIVISLVVINEHRPIVSSIMNNLVFIENSQPLMLGSLANITVQDADSNSDGFIQSLTIELHNARDGMDERLSIDAGTSSLVATALYSHIMLTGIGQPAEYTAVLSTLSYVNVRNEPSLGNRTVTVVASDRNFTSRPLNLTVGLAPVDDNQARFTAQSTTFNYTEESGGILIMKSIGLNITDDDEANSDAVFSGSLLISSTITPVTVANDQLLNISQSLPSEITIQQQRAGIELRGTAPLRVYRSILGSLSYQLTSAEPEVGSLVVRQLQLSIRSDSPADGSGDAGDPLTIRVYVQLINDQAPVISLSPRMVTIHEGNPLAQQMILGAGDFNITDADGDNILNATVELRGGDLSSNREYLSIPGFLPASGISLRRSMIEPADSYRASISQMRYTLRGEPLVTTRVVSISVSDGIFTSYSLLNISLVPSNGFPPVVTSTLSQLNYVEGSMLQRIGSDASVLLSDADSDKFFPLVNATVWLTGARDKMEAISVANAQGFPSINITSSGSQIQASGNGTLAVYQSILLNLQYENPADEPTPGERIVTLRVNDGVHNSADLNISLFVVLRDDNNLTLTCRSSKSLFHMEGASAPTLILPQAVVQDKDQDHIVRQAFVQLQTVLDSGSESLSLNTSMLLGSNLTMTRSSDNTSVTVEGEATDTVYQAALRSIGYMNTAAEPSTGERCAVARVTGGNSSTMSVCTTCFNIKLINDNAPVAYLGGASQINNSVRVLYSSPVRSSVAVAASNTTVTDADTDGTIQSIAAEITSPTLDEAVWLMPCGQKTSGVCALQYMSVGQSLQCSCGGSSTSSGEANVTASRYGINIVAIAGVGMSHQLAATVLRALRYTPASVRPPNLITFREVSVRINDGQFNYIAHSNITVDQNNQPPTIDLNGAQTGVNSSVTLGEGATTNVLLVGQSVLLTDDSGIGSITVTLNNQPDGPAENLLFSGSSGNVKVSTNDFGQLMLNGTVSALEFRTALQSIAYSHTGMANIFERQPNFDTRHVSFEVYDVMGLRSNVAFASVTLLRTCTQSTYRIETLQQLNQLGNCSRVSDGSVVIECRACDSLLPLSRLTYIQNALSIRKMPLLRDLSGLERVEYFAGLQLEELLLLNSTAAIGSETPRSPFAAGIGIFITGCHQLDRIESLEAVNSTTSILLERNDRLSDASGLDNVRTAGILVWSHNGGTALTGFKSLSEITGMMQIAVNPNLLGVKGLTSLQTVDFPIISENPKLEHLDGLFRMRMFGRAVFISENPRLCWILNVTVLSAIEPVILASTGSIPYRLNNKQECLIRQCPNMTVPERNPCFNNGLCMDKNPSSFVCSCASNYSGNFCEQEDFCRSHDCGNGGTCRNMLSGAQCSCSPGYTGVRCLDEVNECNSSPCQNGGVCTDGIGGYNCTCVPGSTGQTCSVDIDECLSTPCDNNGSCTDMLGSYRCTCPPGYTGLSCAADVDECSSSPCDSLGGSCVNLANRYKCNCRDGFSGRTCNASTPAARRLAQCGVPGFDILDKHQEGLFRISKNCSSTFLSTQLQAPFLFASWFWIEASTNLMIASFVTEGNPVASAVQAGQAHVAVMFGGNDTIFPISPPLSEQRWHYISVFVSLSDVTVHVDGVNVGSAASMHTQTTANVVQIGCLPGSQATFSGIIRNPTVSVNTSISYNISTHSCLRNCRPGVGPNCRNSGYCVDLLHGEQDCVCSRNWTGPECREPQTQLSSLAAGRATFSLTAIQDMATSLAIAVRSASNATQNVVRLQQSSASRSFDFLQVSINQSTVHVSARPACTDSSTQPIQLPSGATIQDGEWHNITASVNSSSLHITVDNVSRVVAFPPGNNVSCTSTSAGHLALGHESQGLDGCLGQLSVGDESLDVTTALLSGDVALSCRHSTARFHGLSALRLPPANWTGPVVMSIRLKTRVLNGLVLYAGGDTNIDATGSSATDYIILRVANGVMELEINIVEGLTPLILNQTQVAVADNQWHEISVTFTGSSFTLTVDGQAAAKLLPPSHDGYTLDVSTNDVCLGGIESDGKLVESTPALTPLDGCLSDYRHDGTLVSMYGTSRNVAFGQCNA